MYICICAAVTNRQIERNLQEGADFLELQNNLCVARQCCMCAEAIHKMIATHDKYLDGPNQTSTASD